MKKGRNQAPDNRQKSRLKRALAFHFAFLFGLLFVFGQSFAPANDHQPGSKVQENSHFLTVPGRAQSAHFPFDSLPVPWEPDLTDQGETSDNSDDEPAKLFCRSSLNQQIDVVAAKRLLYQLSLSSKNRETVSLIILHHSWRTFLH